MSMSVAQQNKIFTQIAGLISEEYSGKEFSKDEVFKFLKGSKIKWPTMKTPKDPTKPKGGLSAYIIFTQEVRDKVSKDNPDVAMTELSKIMGKMWKALSDKEKKPYNDKSAKDKLRAQKELEEWKKSKTSVEEVEESDESKGPKPKPALNSWQFFQKSKKAEDSSLSQKDIRALWKDLDDKSQFESLATADKERFSKEMEVYNSK